MNGNWSLLTSSSRGEGNERRVGNVAAAIGPTNRSALCRLYIALIIYEWIIVRRISLLVLHRRLCLQGKSRDAPQLTVSERMIIIYFSLPPAAAAAARCICGLGESILKWIAPTSPVHYPPANPLDEGQQARVEQSLEVKGMIDARTFPSLNSTSLNRYWTWD